LRLAVASRNAAHAAEVAAAVGGRALRASDVLDLGMPPDVEPAVGRLAGVELVDLTALGQHLADRAVPGQIPQVRAIVTAEAAAYTARQDQAAAAPVIAAMHAQIRQLADAELARLHHRLPGLSEQQRAETAATVHRILRKILHRPTVRQRILRQPEWTGLPRSAATALRPQYR
jgi:glutamyl-tRNA reductase